MGNEITGYAIAIDGLAASIQAAENKFDDLAAKSEKTRTKIVAHFKEMGDNGVDYFIKKIEEAKKALGTFGDVKVNLTTNIATQATQDADAINKLLAMMSQLSDKQIQRIGTEQGKLDTQKRLNEIRELKNAEDERARALQRQNKESINNFKILAEQQKTATMQAVAGEKEKQIAIQQTINEIKRMAKAYKMMPTAIRTTGVNNLLQQSQGAVTINQRITAYKNLQNAVKDLDRTEQGWQTNLQRLNTEIERQKRELAALGVSLDNTKRKQRDLAEMATYLAKRMLVLFGINQIKNYAMRLVDIRGEFELQNKSLQILLQNKVKANELWEKTVSLAVESPFRVKELVSYTKQLAAYRIETDQLYDTTKRLADVSAGLGVDMQRLILAYGQVKAASFLRGTELRQFTEAGIPMLEELAKYFTEIEGKAISVGDVFEMISKRMVKFSDVEEVFRRMTDAGGVFYNMQKEQAETLKGQISNLGDRIDLMMNDIGKAHDTMLKGSIAALGWVVENWKAFAWAIQLTVEAFAVYKVSAMIAAAQTAKLAATTTAARSITEKFSLSVDKLKKAFMSPNLNPWVLGITAVLTVAYELWSAWDDNQKKLEEIDKDFQKLKDDVAVVSSKFNISFNKNDFKGQRAALQELVEMANGTYNMDIEMDIATLDDDEVVRQFVGLREKIEQGLVDARETAKAFQEENSQWWVQALTLGINDTMADEIAKYKDKSQELLRALESDRYRILDVMTRSYKDLSVSQNKYIEQLNTPRTLEETDFMYYQRMSGAVQGLIKEYDILLGKGANITAAEQRQLEVLRNVFAQTKLNGGAYKELFKSVAEQSSEARGYLEKFANAVRSSYVATNEQIEAEVQRRINALSEAQKEALSATDIAKIREQVTKELKEASEYKLTLAINEIATANNFDNWQRSFLTNFLNQEFNLTIGVNTPDKKELADWQKRFNKAFFMNKYIKQTTPLETSQDVENRYKTRYEETLEKYNRMLKKAQYYANEDITAVKTEMEAYKAAWDWFTGGTDNKNNKTRKDTKDWWSELAKVIGDAHKEFVKLNEQLDKTDAMSLAVERFKGVYAEVAKNLKALLKPLQDFNLESEEGVKAAYEYLLTKLPASAKNARLEIEKQLSDIRGEAMIKVETEANVQLKQQIEDMFSGYELQLELDKMGLPPEMSELLFNVKPTNLESIRKAIEDKYADATSQADIKNRDELLKKLSEMEDKQMKENFKKYSEYLIKAQNERVKLKLEELNKIAEVEKTFSISQQVAMKRFGVSAEQWRKYKDSGDWSQSGLGEKQLADITAYTAQLNAAADRVRKSLQDETAKKMAKLDWEDFKGSEMYIEIFQNLENASTKSINAILERLQTLKGSFSDLSATEVKDIVSAMTKAEEELESRRPTFKALFSDLKQYIALSKTRNKDEKQYADLQKQSVQNSNELAIARNTLASFEARYRKLTADPNVDKGELEEAKVNMVLMQKQVDDLENAQKRINNKLDETNKKLTLWQRLQKNIGTKLKDIGSGLEGISTLARTIGESFGDLSVEAEKAVQSVSDLGGVVSSIGDVVANPKSFSSWVGLATTAATMFVNLFNNDAEWQKRIEEQERLVNSLQRAYDSLSESIENAYNIGKAEEYNRQATLNLEQQINARRSQINAEQQKKNKDVDQIISWQNEIADMQKQIIELQKKQREEMGGFGTEANYKAAAQQFVDAWYDAYRSTGSGLDALQDTFDDFYDNIVKKQLLYRGTQKILEPLLKMFDNAVMDYTVTEDEAQALQDYFKKNVQGQLDELYKSLADMFGIGQNVELSDLQKGIQNITEAQAAAIESYLNSIRFYVSAQLETIKAIQSSIKAPDYSPIVNELKTQTTILRNIYDTLSSVVGRGGTIHSGAYIKVYM